jgi:hypothetical protein
MNAILPPAERERLQKLMAMLDSNHEGERTAAVDAATRLLGRHGMRWSEVLSVAHIQIIPQDRPPQDAYRRQETSSRDESIDPLRGRDWRKICANCRRHSRYVNAWEDSFLRDLPRRNMMSLKQRATLIAIVLRLQSLDCIV